MTLTNTERASNYLRLWTLCIVEAHALQLSLYFLHVSVLQIYSLISFPYSWKNWTKRISGRWIWKAPSKQSGKNRSRVHTLKQTNHISQNNPPPKNRKKIVHTYIEHKGLINMRVWESRNGLKVFALNLCSRDYVNWPQNGCFNRERKNYRGCSSCSQLWQAYVLARKENIAKNTQVIGYFKQVLNQSRQNKWNTVRVQFMKFISEVGKGSAKHIQ